MATYQAKVGEIRYRAFVKGLNSGSQIGAACGVPAGTINAMLNGRPPSTHTMACLVELLGATVEELFELVTDDEDLVSA